MSAGTQPHISRLEALWETPHNLWGELTTLDHKKIGKRYLVTAMVFLVLGGLEAMTLRVQLAASDMQFLAPEAYNQLFSMHGITMIFWYASPILSGFGNYLIPLMLGARDMALPRLNAFSYWAFVGSGLFFYASMPLAQMPHGGWFAYVPYTLREYSPGLNMDFYALALTFLTVSTTAGAINFLVTIFRMRAPGMSINRMPLFMYSTMTTSVLVVLALPALTAACLFLLLDRNWGTHFFDVAYGGSPLLWQHVFWFFGHPWVYVIFLPATGMISMILPVFARRPIVGYTYVALATVLTGVVGMGVWVHHMFASGMNHLSMSFFSAASMTISIFSAVQVFAWLGTLWGGRPVITTSMLFVLGFLAAFVVGGLNGVVTALIPFDWQLTDTYFVVSHLHYVLVGTNLFPVMAAFYYWLPKITGRMLDERLGRWSFWLMFAGFNLAFFPMHLLGLAGMPRRIYTYSAAMGWDLMNLIVSGGALLFAVGLFVSFVNLHRSLRHGARAGRNPWNADTLEWATDSPPAVYGTKSIPEVRSRHPLWDEHDEEHDPHERRVLDLSRDTLATSAIDAVPLGIARMPRDTIMPLAATLVLAALCTGLLLKSLGVALALLLVLGLVCGWWLWPEAEKLPHDAHGGGSAKGAADSGYAELPLDSSRGTGAMWLFITTEAALFVVLLFAYFFLGFDQPRWPEEPPKFMLALLMLGLLLASSVVLHLGEKALHKGRERQARFAIGGTLALGLLFMWLQVMEYREHLKTVTPWDDAYGSIFYTITTLHGAHLVLGMAMLMYVLLLPRLDPARSPFRPLHNAGLYWHFVDTVWVVIVALLYLWPNFTGGSA